MQKEGQLRSEQYPFKTKSEKYTPPFRVNYNLKHKICYDFYSAAVTLSADKALPATAILHSAFCILHSLSINHNIPLCQML